MATLIRSRNRFAVRTITLVCASLWMIGPMVRAEELSEQAHSLRSIPADASFYSVSLRLKEQFDEFLGSKAYARLMEIPILQLGKMQLMFQWQSSPEPTVTKFREYFASPEGQDSIAILKEMFSDEIFSYGGPDFAEVFPMLMQLNTVQRRAQMEAMGNPERQMEILGEYLLEFFEENAASFKVPDMVFGHRIQDQQRATNQLAHLELMLRELLEEERPDLVERLQHETIGDHQFLTLRLDGSLLPWNEVRQGVEDLDEEQFQKWKNLLGSKTMVVAVGVVDEFVLLSVGDSTDHLATFGQGPKLADNPAFAKLAEHADQRITSIGYVSEILARNTNSSKQQIEDFLAGLEQGLKTAEISEEHQELLIGDFREAAAEFSKNLPERGMVAMVNYRTERGYEGYQYNWGTMPGLDSSQSLNVLGHVGGNPLAFVAGRSKQSVEDYDQAITWIKRIAGHIEQISQEKASPDDWAEYLQVRDKGVALLQRLDRANREFLIPALADGQDALVFDIQAESTQWFAQMPESPKSLPMLEMGMVCNVNDAELLRKGVQEYFAVIEEAMELFHEANPGDFPAAQLPQSETRQITGGTIHVYPLPPEWGVDDQVALNGGLTTTAAAVSSYPSLTERLLQETSLNVDTTIDLNRPAAKVVHINFAKFITALQPWIDYGVAIGTGQLGGEDDEPQDPSPAMMQAGFIVPQVHQLLNVLKTTDSFSAVTYRDGDVWVTHGETRMKDLE